MKPRFGRLATWEWIVPFLTTLRLVYIVCMCHEKIKLDFNESPLIVIHTFYWPEELARRVSGKLSWQM